MDASSLHKAAKGAREKAKQNVAGLETSKQKETKAQKEARLAKEKLEKAKKVVVDKTKKLKSSLRQNMSVEMLMQGIDNVKQLREKMRGASIDMIEKIEDRYPGISLAAYTTHLNGSKKLDLKNWSSDKIYQLFKPGARYKVDFLGNDDAEQKWGLADMLDITMRHVTKYEGGNINFKRESVRRVGLKGQNKAKRGFYDYQGYMAIHTGDVFEFDLSNPEYKDLYRKKPDGTYKEIDEESYRKYAASKDAQKDHEYIEKKLKDRMFITKRSSISREKIIEIRKKIGGLEGLPPGQRVTKVAMFLTRPENNMYARHCGDWVDRVYAIAGITRKKTHYMNLSYAFVGGNRRNGWKPEGDKSRRDCRIEGVFASGALLNRIQSGDWLWVNNRNRFDKAGNHSVIFLGWVNKKKRIARVASWYGNAKGRQKISTYNFNNMPVTAIRRATQATDILPEPRRSRFTSTAEDYEAAKKKMEGSDKSEMATKGMTPFIVKRGYRMTPEERTIYMRESKEARRLSKMSMWDRLEIMQKRYKLKDALDLAFRALRLKEKHRKYFMAWSDATMYIESRYNPIAVNRRNGKIALSTATGAYQILNSVWKSTCDKWFRDTKKARRYRRWYNRRVPEEYKIDFDLFKDIDFNQPLPGLATPYQHAIFHSIYVFKGSRMYKGSMAFDEVFDKLQSGSLSPEMKYSYQAYLYNNWRNGHGGAKVFLQMMKRGIPFPRNKAEAREYFEQMPNCWQKRRGFGDFATLVRACSVFVRRFNKNLREQGES